MVSVSILAYFLLVAVIITVLGSVNMEYSGIGVLLVLTATLLWALLMVAFGQFYKRNQSKEEARLSADEKKPDFYINLDSPCAHQQAD